MYYKNIFIASILSIMFACSDGKTVKYYAVMDGDHGSRIFRFDNIREFKEEIDPENKMSFYYKVELKSNKPTYAEYINVENKITAFYEFDERGRVVKNKYYTSDDNYILCDIEFDDNEQTKFSKCHDDKGNWVESLKHLYKNNIKHKTIHFDEMGKVKNYYLYDYSAKTMSKFDKDGTLLEVIDIAKHFP